MEEYITVTAKTVKDAILEASLKLETFRDNIEYEVIEEDLLTTEEGKITHNSLKLSSVIFSYLMR